MSRRIIGLETEYGSIPNNATTLYRFLPNGGYLYTDTGYHFEFATPETTNPLDAMIYYSAGDLVFARETGGIELEHRLKNNTDGEFTHGCHENYSFKRVSDSEYNNRVINLMLPFLVTRQIFTGAGKVHRRHPYFQLTQRAPFMRYPVSLHTTEKRAIFNLRDEPLADESKFRRIHLIVGDSNMSQVSTFLKVGTTALVVDMAEEGMEPFIRLRSPVKSLKRISSDTKLNWLVKLDDGRSMSAIDIQRLYLARADRYHGRDEITDDVLARWEGTLNKLAKKEPADNLGRELDWAIKLRKCLHLMDDERIGWDHPRVRDLDLMYHKVGKDSMFSEWENSGDVETIAYPEDIESAADNPPKDTRAWLRGNVVEMFPDTVKRFRHAVWDYIPNPHIKEQYISVPDPFLNHDELVTQFKQGAQPSGP
jgi:proteasome accessory factor A